jgi:hypothetical protein
LIPRNCQRFDRMIDELVDDGPGPKAQTSSGLREESPLARPARLATILSGLRRGASLPFAFPVLCSTTSLSLVEAASAIVYPIANMRASGANPRRFKVGRHASCDVVLDDPRVSRAHATIELEGGACTVTDEGSANGTFVNAVQLEPRKPVTLFGDVVTIHFGVTSRLTVLNERAFLEYLKSLASAKAA